MTNYNCGSIGDNLFAALPPEEKLYWGQEPVNSITSFREELCLNGLWRFIPALSPDESRPRGEWGYINVPGGWRNVIPWVPMPGIAAYGTGGNWEGFDGLKAEVGWYERSLKIPDAWSDCSIILEQRRGISTAAVFIDGLRVDSFDILKPAIELTDYVKPGSEVVLSILVTRGPGLQGDVFLSKRPRGGYISDIFIITSTRKKEITLEVEISDCKEMGSAEFAAIISNENGLVEKTIKEQAILSNKERQIIRYTYKWENPRLWDIGQPNLYKLMFKLKGAGIRDEFCQTFGFRECWIEGRKFFLNGTEIRFRPVLCKDNGNIKVIPCILDSYSEAGFNIAEIWPNKEKDSSWDLWYECADKKGFAMTGALGNMWNYIPDWDRAETRELYEAATLVEMKALRNHPSILLWGTNANVFGSGLGMDPRTIGVKKDHWFDSFYWRKRRSEAGEQGIGIIKKLDPTRAVFTHHGGGVGDVYTLNCYLNLIPLQEREEWLSHWVKNSNMPFMIVEFGTPLHVTFMRGRTDFGGAVVTEPLLTEFCTIYLGKEAYDIETEEYREKIKEHFIGGQDYSSWHVKEYFDFAPNLQKLLYLFNRNTWRSWRTMGMTGGMIPWNDGHGWGKSGNSHEEIDLGEFKPGTIGWYNKSVSRYEFFGFSSKGSRIYPSGKAIMENNGPALSWIAGPKEAFTAKDHSFYTGSRVEKQIVIINDTRKNQIYNISVKIFVNEKQIEDLHFTGEIETGSTRFIPVKFYTPDEITGEKAQGEICLRSFIGEFEYTDSFVFRVFKKRERQGRNVYVFDPLGLSTEMLKKLGFKVTKWNGELDAPMVIIGREALSCRNDSQLDIFDAFRKYIEAGGRGIIFSQKPQWFNDYFGLRTCPHVTRRVFGIDAGHPVMKDLDDYDLSDWSGESGLIESYPEYSPKKTRLAKWWFPYHGYHWGNRGGVSSCAVEKPHFGSFRPILECEFDLAYSPLMEMDYGKGRFLLCTLDLEDHYKSDPAAEIIAVNILDYAKLPYEQEKTSGTVYIGCLNECSILDLIGLVYKKENKIDNDAGLLILGSDSAVDRKEVFNYLDEGGKVFVLSVKTAVDMFGLDIQLQKGFNGCLKVPDWKECEGLSSSDFRLKTSVDFTVIAKGAETGADGMLGRIKTGKGTVIFSMLDPERLEADRNTYFRMTRWRMTRSIAQIISNMGGTFKSDDRIFKPHKEHFIDLSGEWDSTLQKPINFSIGQDSEITDIMKKLGTWIGNEKAYDGMKKVELPLLWEDYSDKWEDIGNEVVFSKTVMLPESWEGKELLLSLGKIDNTEDTFFNGVQISRLEKKPPAPHNYPRVYSVPGQLVRSGKNIITVCIFDRLQRFDAMGGGGFAGPGSEMFLTLKPVKGDSGFYHHDYRYDYVYGDDPYRYFNW